jgi:hypothetical protein
MVTGEKKLYVHSRWSGGILLKKKFIFFVRFLKRFLDIAGYNALHYTVDRLNLQLSICMVCFYVNTTTRSLNCLA